MYRANSLCTVCGQKGDRRQIPSALIVFFCPKIDTFVQHFGQAVANPGLGEMQSILEGESGRDRLLLLLEMTAAFRPGRSQPRWGLTKKRDDVPNQEGAA